jgi:hypothetical protein
MTTLRKLISPLFLCVLCVSTNVACHRPHAWQPIPNAPSIQPPKEDFTLVWDKEDANGGPLDPYWGLEKIQNEIPPREQGQHPYPCELDPYAGKCTENKGIVKDAPLFPNSVICKIGNLTAPFDGHADWVVATQQGCVDWEGHTPDDDYNFRLFPPDPNRSGLTKNNGQFIGLEFDFAETLVNAQLQTWTEVRDEVVQEDNGQDSRQAEIGHWLNPSSTEKPPVNPRAAVVGIFGLDCEHGCKSEVHPVLAFAVEIKADPNDDTWVLFVRNWGTGGYCSQYRHLVNFPNNQLSILLVDDPGSGGATLIPGTSQMFATPGSNIAFPTVSYWQGHGPVVTFTLPSPEQTQAYAELEIHLRWNNFVAPACGKPPVGLAKRRAVAAPNEAESAEDYLSQAEQQLGERDAAEKVSFRKAMASKKKLTPALVQVPVAAEERVLPSFTPLTASAKSKAAAPALTADKAKSEHDVNYILELCKADQGKLPPYRGQDISAQLCDQKKLNKQLQKDQK